MSKNTNDPNPEDFYKRLKNQLKDTSDWPNEYLFKFVVKSDNHKIALIEEIFDNMGAVIHTKASSKGKYTSISVNVKLKNAQTVVDKYKEVGAAVPDVISL